MPIDRSDPVNSLNMCNVRASFVSHFHFSCPVAMDVIALPSGSSTLIPLPFSTVVIFSIACISFILMKLPVVPVSALARLSVLLCVVLIVDGVRFNKLSLLVILLISCNVSSTCLNAAPRRHSFLALKR